MIALIIMGVLIALCWLLVLGLCRSAGRADERLQHMREEDS